MTGSDPAFTGGIRARAGPVLAPPGVAAGVPWPAYPAHVSRTAAIPTGTITLLFTDVEGSTRLWEAEPEPMARACPSWLN